MKDYKNSKKCFLQDIKNPHIVHTLFILVHHEDTKKTTFISIAYGNEIALTQLLYWTMLMLHITTL